MIVAICRDTLTIIRDAKEVKFSTDASTNEHKLLIDGESVFIRMTLEQRHALEVDFLNYLATGNPGPYMFTAKDTVFFGQDGPYTPAKEVVTVGSKPRRASNRNSATK